MAGSRPSRFSPRRNRPRARNAALCRVDGGVSVRAAANSGAGRVM